MEVSEKRYLGRSVESSIKSELKRILGEDREALMFAEKVLEEYVRGGSRAVKRFLEKLLEGEEGVDSSTKKG